MDETTKERASSPDRRTVIKGAAAGMAAVWTVPIVSSFTTPAMAAGSAGNPNPECTGANCATFTPGCSTASADCVCTSTATGGGFCVPGGTSCGAGSGACPGGQGDCQAGELCLVDTCCGGPVCIPINLGCPPSAAGAGATGTYVPAGSGTIGG